MTDEQRVKFAKESTGKKVVSACWERDGDYWVFEFEDGTEVSFRLMAGIERP